MLSRKVPSLTKPKGKIYKAKSLGYYVTIISVFRTCNHFFGFLSIFYLKQFYFNQFSLAYVHILLLIDSYIGPYHRDSVPESNGNEGVLGIPQNPSIIGASPADCLMLYQGHSLVGGLPNYRESVGVFYNPSRLGHRPLVHFPSF